MLFFIIMGSSSSKTNHKFENPDSLALYPRVKEGIDYQQKMKKIYLNFVPLENLILKLFSIDHAYLIIELRDFNIQVELTYEHTAWKGIYISKSEEEIPVGTAYDINEKMDTYSKLIEKCDEFIRFNENYSIRNSNCFHFVHYILSIFAMNYKGEAEQLNKAIKYPIDANVVSSIRKKILYISRKKTNDNIKSLLFLMKFQK